MGLSLPVSFDQFFNVSLFRTGAGWWVGSLVRSFLPSFVWQSQRVLVLVVPVWRAYDPCGVYCCTRVLLIFTQHYMRVWLA